MPELRMLNMEGSEAFEEWLRRAKDGSRAEPPFHLLKHRTASVDFPPGEVHLDRRRFKSRWAFARYLDGQLTAADAMRVDLLAGEYDGMWDWLSLLYIDDVCSVSSDGGRRIFEPYRYILNPSMHNKHYGRQPRKHLLRNAYELYRMWGRDEPEAIDLLMVGKIENTGGHQTMPLGLPGVIRESLGALLAARALFFDDEHQAIRSGCSGSLQDYAQWVRALDKSHPIQRTSHIGIINKLLDLSCENIGNKGGHQDLWQWIRRHRNRLDALIANDRVVWASDGRRKREVSALIRDDSLRGAVLDAYDHRCAVSGVGIVDARLDAADLFEVEAAHIRPASREGPDIVPNAIALTRTLHWAFDRGMWWIGDDYHVQVHPEVRASEHNEPINRYHGKPIQLPNDEQFWPNLEHLRWHAHHIAGVDLVLGDA